MRSKGTRPNSWRSTRKIVSWNGSITRPLLSRARAWRSWIVDQPDWLMEDGSRMRQVLFTIPIFGGIKLFGYGSMMVLAFIGSTWAATWRARREKLDPDVILDM